VAGKVVVAIIARRRIGRRDRDVAALWRMPVSKSRPAAARAAYPASSTRRPNSTQTLRAGRPTNSNRRCQARCSERMISSPSCCGRESVWWQRKWWARAMGCSLVLALPRAARYF